MRKSILSLVLIIFVISITLVVIAEWFALHSIRKFNGKFAKVLNIALIKPTFTGAAYHKSFYNFYFIYSSVPPHARKNITSELNLLSSELTNQTTRSSSAFSIDYLGYHLKTSKSNVTILTDADADYGSIFNNGSNKYDIIILGHQEYVTQREYDNLKQFVSNGGILV